MIALFLGLALAQEVQPEAPVDDDVYEVVVWGEAAIRHARYEVVRALEAAGWTKGRERDGVIVFRPPSPWMGRASLTFDGELLFRRPVLTMRVKPLGEPRTAPDPSLAGDPTQRDPSYIGGTNAVQGHDAGTVWVLPGMKVLEPAREKAHRAIESELRTYRDVVEETRRREAL